MTNGSLSPPRLQGGTASWCAANQGVLGDILRVMRGLRQKLPIVSPFAALHEHFAAPCSFRFSLTYYRLYVRHAFAHGG